MSLNPRHSSSSKKASNKGAVKHARKAPVEREKVARTAASGGAKNYKAGVSDHWQAYLAHHSFSAKDSLMRLLQTPIQSLMTWLVIAVALALPATLFTGLDNLQALGERWDGTPQMSLFISPRARPAAIDQLQQRLQQHPQIEAMTFISAEQALQNFEEHSGMGNALRSLDANPLPPTLLIEPRQGITPGQLQQLGDTLQAEPIVEDLLYDQAWIERLHEILRLGEQLVIVFGALFAIGVLLVIGNTIRLTIESRRDEIVIIKLVGGTDAFVRRPFLYTGFWYGLMGALLAWLLLQLGLAALDGPVANLARLYQSSFQLSGLGLQGSVILISFGVLVGWIGAWLAVGRHLGAIQPQ